MLQPLGDELIFNFAVSTVKCNQVRQVPSASFFDRSKIGVSNRAFSTSGCFWPLNHWGIALLEVEVALAIQTIGRCR